MCGEQLRIAQTATNEQGSPPRVRGTGFARAVAGHVGRITPACAGNSFQRHRLQCGSEDHPRVCGEQIRAEASRRSEAGSPPRVRGTEQPQLVGASNQRITPACAGNSNPLILRFRNALGSPPRVRGTVSPRWLFSTDIGITPACAGNRPHSGFPGPMDKDHPRVCGEQTKKSPSFQHSLLSDQENSFSLKYNCSISSQSFCARWTSLQGSSKCFAKVDS